MPKKEPMVAPSRLCQLSQSPPPRSDPSQPPRVEPMKMPIQMSVFDPITLLQRPTVVSEWADLCADFQHGQGLVKEAYVQSTLIEELCAVIDAGI